MAASRFRLWPPNRCFVLLAYRTTAEAQNTHPYLPLRILQSNQHARYVHHYPSSHGQHRSPEHRNQKSLYDTLGLAPYSSQSDIKRKYYELSKLHHPDRNQGDPTANDRFVEISQAYKILSDPASKASYDSSLRVLQPRSGWRCHSQRGPVGGREAGGLSRRPVSPQGPPPSYYRDRPIKSDAHTNTPYPSRFNWDEKYRQHYVYQQRFRKGSRAHNKHPGKSDYSDLSDFCFRAVAVGTCILLVGVLGRWFITETGTGRENRV
ncbi:DNAj domain protein [Orbilia javanica]|uniref:DNAj domain protein n=1 Tax=Orbilia javanica TaxID=47235 RepID=A0AAN8N8Z0_9PEZI